MYLENDFECQVNEPSDHICNASVDSENESKVHKVGNLCVEEVSANWATDKIVYVCVR